MKHALMVIASLGMIAGIAQSQQPPEALPPAEALYYMLGHWQGEGWRLSPQGERQVYRIEERLMARAGGHAISIVGTGMAGEGDAAREIHNAFGVIWQERDGSYRMRSVVAPGYTMETTPELTDNGYIWVLDAGPMTIRYESVVEHGVWIETGEQVLPSGETVQVHEMRLRRVD
ncbi:hypothetical protein [Hyphobacterium sp.]|uniref:hypothetical protein n=1 Tax=Hyphobacterium sp. TaxID=2004662 RepID=UPI003B52EE26